ncbi:MAG: DUF6249 domain-containing protein [Rikenellaceae bacterium]
MEGVLGIVIPFTTAVLIVLIVFLAKVFKEKSRNELIAKAIEHGKDLSPDLFTKEGNSSKKSDPLTSALVSIGVGVGLFIAFYFFFGGFKFAAFGCIPLFIGIGQLVAYFVNRKQKETDKTISE